MATAATTSSKGGAGNDTLYGGAGDDILYGDAAGSDSGGNDALFDDGGGNDRLYGQGGNDYISVSRRDGTANVLLLDGGAGDDYLSFSRDRHLDTVTILGGSGNDEIVVGAVFQSTIDAGSGDDIVGINRNGGLQTITLGAGQDVLQLWELPLNSSLGPATIITDMTEGEDRLILEEYLSGSLVGWDPATNPFAGGFLQLIDVNGTATLLIDWDGSAGDTWGPYSLMSFTGRTAASLTERELGYASNGDAPTGETIVAASAGERLWGTNGADIIEGRAGDDRIFGRAGDDLIQGREGHDILFGGLGNDRLYGNDIDDTGADSSSDILRDLFGGNDSLFGQGGDDSLYVSRTNQSASSTVLLDGGEGDDTIFFTSIRHIDEVTAIGGAGDDQIFIGGIWSACIDAGEGNDRVELNIFGGSQSVTLGAGDDTIVVQALPAMTVYGLGSPVFVTDFTVGEDRLSLTSLVVSTSQNLPIGSNPFATGHLQLVADGADTLIQYDRDGASGDDYAFATIFRLVGVAPDSLSATELGYAPDGSDSAAFASQDVAFENHSGDSWSDHGYSDAVRALAQFDHPVAAGDSVGESLHAAFAQPAADGAREWPMLGAALPDAALEHLQMY